MPEKFDNIFRAGRAALIRSEMEVESAYEQVFEDAPDPRLDLMSTDGMSMNMRRDNTMILEHPNYPEFDHILHQPLSGDCVYIWREQVPEVFDEIKKTGFDLVTSAIPTEEAYELWIACQIQGAFTPRDED